MLGFVRTLAIALFTTGAAYADDYPIVVELFTSQGCSSCPPADELLAQLADRDDVIPLALHVDYWDYIGWKDEFALPLHTDRQRRYSASAGKTMVYTPQMVVGGVEHLIGYQPMQLADTLNRIRERQKPVGLEVSKSGDQLQVEINPAREVGGPVVVQLVRFNESATVKITRGENRGRTITYSNIVTSWEQLALWDGSSPLSVETEVAGPQSVAVILQSGGNGPILAAAQVR